VRARPGAILSGCGGGAPIWTSIPPMAMLKDRKTEVVKFTFSARLHGRPTISA